MINTIIQGGLLVILGMYYFLDLIPSRIENGFLLTIIIYIAIGIVSFFGFRNEGYGRLKRQYLKFSMLFILSFLIVHFQAYFDLILGLQSKDNQFIWIDDTIVNKASVISGMALISFFLGYSLSKPGQIIERVKIRNYRIKDFGILQSLLIILFAVFIFSIDPSFLRASEYGSRTESTISGLSSFFFEATYFSLIILKSINLRNSNKWNISIWGYFKNFGLAGWVILSYILIILLSGERGPIIYMGLGFISSYLYVSRKKFRAISIISVVIAFATFMMILGVARNLENQNSFSDALLASIEGKEDQAHFYPESFSNATKELAGSVRAVHIAVSNVPEKFDYFKGWFQLQNISLIIPGLNGKLNEILNVPEVYRSSPNFITFLDRGIYATWGAGSSSVADIYLDFGVIGIVFIFLVFGMFSRKIEVIMFVYRDPSLVSLAFSVLFFSYSIYMARSHLLTPLVKLPYILAISYLQIFISRRNQNEISIQVNGITRFKARGNHT